MLEKIKSFFAALFAPVMAVLLGLLYLLGRKNQKLEEDVAQAKARIVLGKTEEEEKKDDQVAISAVDAYERAKSDYDLSRH